LRTAASAQTPLNILNWLWAIEVVLCVAVVVRIYQMRLVRRYPALVTALSIGALRSLVLSNLNFRSNAYGITYVVTEPLTWAAGAWVAFEIYRHVLVSYQGISILGRRSLAAGLTISAGIAFFTSLQNIRWTGELYPVLLITAALSQWVSLTLLLFLALISLFILWYPIPLRRNLVYYALGYSLVFVSLGFGFFIRSAFGPQMARGASYTYLAVWVGCLVFWLFGLRQSGEEVSLALGSALRAGDQDRLLAQVEALNAMLLDSGRRD